MLVVLFDIETFFRLEEFAEMMRTTPGVGIGLDDHCAIQIRGHEYKILAWVDGAKAHRIFWVGDSCHHEYIDRQEVFCLYMT